MRKKIMSRGMKAGFFGLALIVAGQAGSLKAATLVTSASDSGITSAGALNQDTNYAVRIGEYFYPGGTSFVLPFLLPTLSLGEVFDTANLRVQLFGVAGTPAPLDLYGLGTRTVSTVLAGDYYSGSAVDTTDATLIQAAIITSATPVRIDPNNGFVETNAGGDSALVSYLNTQYAGGANAGKYVFLRFSYADVIPASNTAYEILTSEAGGTFEKPEFSYTVVTVPEPSTYALVALGLGSLWALRRKKITS